MEEIRQKEFRLMELLAVTRKIFVENGKAIFICTFLLYLPIAVMETMLSFYTSEILMSVDLSKVMQTTDALMQFVTSPQGKQIALYNMLHFLAQTLLLPFVIAGCAKLSQEALSGRKAVFTSGVAAALEKAPILLLVTLLHLAATTIGFMFFFVPGYIISIYFTFIVYSVVIGGNGVFSSFKESVLLVHNRFFKTLGFIIFFNLSIYIFSTLLDYLFMFSYGSYFMTALSRILDAWIHAYFFIAYSVWYCNRKTVVQGQS